MIEVFRIECTEDFTSEKKTFKKGERYIARNSKNNLNIVAKNDGKWVVVDHYEGFRITQKRKVEFQGNPYFKLIEKLEVSSIKEAELVTP